MYVYVYPDVAQVMFKIWPSCVLARLELCDKMGSLIGDLDITGDGTFSHSAGCVSCTPRAWLKWNQISANLQTKSWVEET